MAARRGVEHPSVCAGRPTAAGVGAGTGAGGRCRGSAGLGPGGLGVGRALGPGVGAGAGGSAGPVVVLRSARPRSAPDGGRFRPVDGPTANGGRPQPGRLSADRTVEPPHALRPPAGPGLRHATRGFSGRPAIGLGHHPWPAPLASTGAWMLPMRSGRAASARRRPAAPTRGADPRRRPATPTRDADPRRRPAAPTRGADPRRRPADADPRTPTRGADRDADPRRRGYARSRRSTLKSSDARSPDSAALQPSIASAHASRPPGLSSGKGPSSSSSSVP